jgi:hypothetical protein
MRKRNERLMRLVMIMIRDKTCIMSTILLLILRMQIDLTQKKTHATLKKVD